MPRRKCVFNKKLEGLYPFLEITKSNSDLHCLKCGGRFSIASGGKYDILTHLRAKKHIRANKHNVRDDTSSVPVTLEVEKSSNIEMCRLCKKYANAQNAKNLFHKEQEVLLAQIAEVTSSMLRNDFNLPSFICHNCEERLKRAYRFRMLCLESFAYFDSIEYKDWLGKKSNKSIQNVDEVDEVEVVKAQQLEEVMVEIKEEANSTDANENDMLALTNESDNSSSTINDLSISEVKLNESSNLSKLTPNSGEKKKPIEKCTKRKTKQKGCKEKVDYICEHCGNHFNLRQHFITHLRRHTNNKPFTCEVCPKQCYTSSELKHHMRRHTGERPFACKYCERRFADYSTRVRHERTHTNERPYACEQCGKAFTRSNLLQKHLLVHTGERAFKCVECDKAFQTRTSLNVHRRSILHRQMVRKHEIDKELNSMGDIVILKIQS